MKHLSVSATVVAVIVMTAGTVNGACTSLTKCRQNSGNNCNCCPTGTSEREYTCPTGWSASGSTCYRSATRSSDSIGYTETTYGSCAATAGNLIQCYQAKCGTPIPSCTII